MTILAVAADPLVKHLLKTLYIVFESAALSIHALAERQRKVFRSCLSKNTRSLAASML
jgi:hypothetical protein